MTTYLPVLTKGDFVKRYQQGEFGNRGRTWLSLEEWSKGPTYWNHHQLFHIRNRIAGGPTWYNVPIYKLPERWAEVTKKVDPTNLYITEMAPHQYNLIQGEYLDSDRGPALLYSKVPDEPMREALALQCIYKGGIIALETLRHYLCSNSYEWLQELRERYPGHAIEFSTFSIAWGTLPNFNTAFWEVRLY